MKRRKTIIISLCVSAVVAAILIPILLLPRLAPHKVVVIPLRKMLRLSWAPGQV